MVPDTSPAPIRLRAEGMGERLAERGVAIGSEVSGIVVRLVGGAVRRPAEDALPIGRRELGVDVDRCKTPHIQASALQRGAKEAERLTGIDVGQVPGGALAAKLAKVAEAVLGEDHVGGDACVVADEAAVAATSLAVGAVRVAARAAPRTDALKKCQQVVREGLVVEAILTRAWSSTPKLALWPGSSRLPKATEGSGWPLGALPTAGQTAVPDDDDEGVRTLGRFGRRRRRTEPASVHEIDRERR